MSDIAALEAVNDQLRSELGLTRAQVDRLEVVHKERIAELEHEVSTLTSKLALKGEALDQSHQSITELHARIAVLEAENNEVHEHLYNAAKACSEAVKRFAELEATVQAIPKSRRAATK